MEDDQLTERVATALRAATRDVEPSPELDARVAAILGGEHRRRRWVLPLLAAVTAVLLGVTAVVVNTARDGRDDTVVTTGEGDTGASGSWEELDAGPLAPRAEPQAVWTGAEMIVVGGLDVERYAAFADGAVYDPRRGTWRRIPERPDPGRIMVAAWTGAELFALGAREGVELKEVRSVHLYDPRANRWRAASPPPRGFDSPEEAWWTGHEVLVWQFGGGMLYDPQTDTWRDIPPADVPGASAPGRAEWLDGAGLLAVQGATRPESGGPLRPALFLFDPESARWRQAAPPPGAVAGFNGATAAWLGREVVFNPFPGEAARAYDPTADSWRLLPSLELARDQGTGYFTGLPIGDVGGVVRVGDSAHPLVVLTAGGAWSYPPAPPGPVPAPGGAVVWTGSEVLLWGRPDGPGAQGNAAWRWTPGPRDTRPPASPPVDPGAADGAAPYAPSTTVPQGTPETGTPGKAPAGAVGPVLRSVTADLGAGTITVTFDQPVDLGSAPLAAMYLVVFGADPTCATPAGNSHEVRGGAGTTTLTLDATSLARPTSYIRLAPGFVTSVASGAPSEPTGCIPVPTA